VWGKGGSDILVSVWAGVEMCVQRACLLLCLLCATGLCMPCVVCAWCVVVMLCILCMVRCMVRCMVYGVVWYDCVLSRMSQVVCVCVCMCVCV
jgi:hypothetical protein